MYVIFGIHTLFHTDIWNVLQTPQLWLAAFLKNILARILPCQQWASCYILIGKGLFVMSLTNYMPLSEPFRLLRKPVS